LKRPRSEHNRVLKGHEGVGHRHNWIRNLHDVGLTYQIEVIQELPDREILSQAEIFWIAYFRNLGADLTNLTDGGLGALGWRHTPESLRKLKLANKGKRPSPQCRSASLIASTGNRWQHTEEAKRKISSLKTGQKYRPTSAEARKNKSIAHGGRPFTDQFGNHYRTLSEAASKTGVDRTNISAVLKGKYKQCNGFVFVYD
jgi:hypothetical protein